MKRLIYTHPQWKEWHNRRCTDSIIIADDRVAERIAAMAREGYVLVAVEDASDEK